MVGIVSFWTHTHTSEVTFIHILLIVIFLLPGQIGNWYRNTVI